MADDRECMELAVAHASRSRGESGRISPMVGAVIRAEPKGNVIAESHRGEDDAHKEHAEFNAFENKLKHIPAAGSTVFTTLEPCFKRGVGKIPCAERLAARQVGRVFIGMLDPDPTVHGKGEMYLLERGIEVQRFHPDLTKQILEQNREFIRDRQTPGFKIDETLGQTTLAAGEVKLFGTYRAVPRDDERYTILTRRGNTYWPQGRFARLPSGKWECMSRIDTPGEIDVLIVRLSRDASLWMDLYLQVGRNHGKWEGLSIPSLPDGIEVHDRITIRVRA